MTYLPERTIKYKTYLKTALIEGLKPVFQHHIDSKLQNTKVTIDFPKDRQQFPAIVVRFYESEIKNAGIGHEEHFVDSDDNVWKFKHYMYNGDIEFGIYSLSTLDRDLIADTVVQTIAMGGLADYTNRFFNRIYPDPAESVPDSVAHHITINSDQMSAVGEAQSEAPWQSEDELLYTISYRVKMSGEFYSLPQDMPYKYITEVLTYPYIEDYEDPPAGLEGESSWIGAFNLEVEN